MGQLVSYLWHDMERNGMGILRQYSKSDRILPNSLKYYVTWIKILFSSVVRNKAEWITHWIIWKYEIRSLEQD